MPKKPTKSNSSSYSRSSTSKPAPAKFTPAKSTPAASVGRNTPIPRPSPMKRDVSPELIAKRAYEIFISGKGSDQLGNWLRAERELKGQ